MFNLFSSNKTNNKSVQIQNYTKREPVMNTQNNRTKTNQKDMNKTNQNDMNKTNQNNKNKTSQNNTYKESSNHSKESSNHSKELSNSNLNKFKINDKFHFFIGNIFDSPNQIKSLINLRKKLKQKYQLRDSHWNNKFYTNIIYLGYFDMETAEIYMDDIIKPLLEAIAKNIHVLNCKYTGFKIDYDTVFHKISLKINDNDNLLETVIVPYLHNNGILPIFNKKKTIYKPTIDVLYYKSSSKVQDKKNIRVQPPPYEFKIDHLSLIKGTPVKYRPGTPSLHDQMHIEEIFRYNVKLTE
jgi:hypothetical protein